MGTTKIKVGQKLWWVPRWRSYEPACWVEVTKVGRVYATISFKNIRIRLTNLESVNQDSYRDAGRCYVDKEAHEAREKVMQMWCEIRTEMHKGCPDDVTVEQVEAAGQLLGLHMEDFDGNDEA